MGLIKAVAQAVGGSFADRLYQRCVDSPWTEYKGN